MAYALQPVILLKDQTSDGVGNPITVFVGITSGVIEVTGNFDGASVLLQTSLDGVNWNYISDLSYNVFEFTESVSFGIVLAEGMMIRAVVTGSSQNTSVNAGMYYRRGA